VIPGLPANGNNIALTFADANDPTCSQSVNVAQLPCSTSCVFAIDQASPSPCDDNGTPSDNTDDTFVVTVNASATNGGANNQFTVTDGTTTWGPFNYGVGGMLTGLPADGSTITLTFSDVDDISCNASQTVSSESCSDLCVFTIEEAMVLPCDNQGSLADASDDLFSVMVNASAINPGLSNQFTVSDGISTWGPFDYGTGGLVSGLPANGNNITLTFTDANLLTCNSMVVVSQQPCSACDLVIDAGPNQLINCANPVVQLLGESSEAALFEWSGPGINSNNINEEQPFVDQPGTYTLTVSNLNTGCTETDNVLVNQTNDVPVAMAAGGEFTCETTSITLNSSGSSTGPNFVYTWSGPDPDLDVNAPNPVITVPGLYVLVVTDITTNCASPPAGTQVGNNTQEPVAIINLIGSLTCISVGALLDGAGSSVGDSIQYQWLFGETAIPGATDITFQANQQGMYTFVVLNILNGCDAADSLFVEDDMTYPIASAGTPALLTCYEDSVQLDGSASTNLVQITYEWSGPSGGILSGGNTTMPWVILPGAYILSVVDTLNGCENLDTVIVSQDIVSPFADAGEDVSLDCISLEAVLDGTNSTTGNLYGFEWMENNGNIVSGAGSLEPVVDEAGLYTLIITNFENGCTATDNVLVNIPDAPTEIYYTAVDPVCFGDNNGLIIIDSVAGGQAPYLFGLNDQPLTTNNFFGLLSSGNYVLNVEDNQGCSFQTSITLQEGNNLFIELGEDQTIDLGDSTTLHALVNIPPSFVDSLQWTPLTDPTYGMTLSCYNCYHPVAKPYRTTEYTATVWDLDGCIAKDDITIKVIIDRNVFIPSAFSPTGDGINDIFLIYGGIDVLEINSFQIYNRWGELVFEDYGFQPNKPDHGWDGTFRGEPMNPAVFAYWAEITFIDGYKKFYKGDVTLLK
jgi:gliding motility-associated-like protein